MKKSLSIFMLLVCSQISLAADQLYNVKAVEDGDTLVILTGDQEVRVQLLGIDAPEDVANPKLQKDQERTQLDQQSLLKLGQMATRQLQMLTEQGQVSLQGDLKKKDRYGRVPMMVFDTSGRSLNEAMISEGYAVVMSRYPFPDALKAAWLKFQQDAISNKQGLWADETSSMTKAWAK